MDELIARLEAATGPDRELDMAIHIAADRCNPTATFYPDGNCLSWFEYHPEVPGGASEFLTDRLPCYTNSIDTALSAGEPGWEYSISTLYGLASVELPLNDTMVDPVNITRKDGDVPRALLTAIFKARSILAEKREE